MALEPPAPEPPVRESSGPELSAPAPGCWLHPDIEVRPSPIAELGLFARAAMSPGTAVSRLGGRLVSDEELRHLIAAAQQSDQYVDSIAVEDDVNLVVPPGQLNHYGNHSCDPNLWWVDAYTLAAQRPIEPGEELTSDYATSTGAADFAMTCACGAPGCRGLVTGQDWRRPELQERYAGHWVPVLLRRIRLAFPGHSPIG